MNNSIILLYYTGEEINGCRRATISNEGRNQAALIRDPQHPCWGSNCWLDINQPLTANAVVYTDPDWYAVWDLSTDGTFVVETKLWKKCSFYWGGTLHDSRERYKVFSAFDGAEIIGQPKEGYVHIEREWDRRHDPAAYRPNVPVQALTAIDEEGNYFLIYNGIIYGPFARDFWQDGKYVVEEELYYQKTHIGSLPDEVDRRLSDFLHWMPGYQFIPKIVEPFAYIGKGICPSFHLPNRWNDTSNLIDYDVPKIKELGRFYWALPDLQKFREKFSLNDESGIADSFIYDGYKFTSWVETEENIGLFSIKNRPIVLEKRALG